MRHVLTMDIIIRVSRIGLLLLCFPSYLTSIHRKWSGAHVSRCRMSRSWRLGVEALAKSTRERECCYCPRRPNPWLAKLPRSVKLEGDLQQNRRLPLTPPMLSHRQDRDRFYEKGHRVVGVEVVEAPVREFFHENTLPCEESFCPVLNRKILQTPDKRLRIFICNIFEFNTSCAGPMDVVWDKGSLIVIGDADAPRYVSILKSLLAPNFSYGLWVIDYDAEGYAGTPRPMPEGRIRNLFGDGMKLTMVDKSEPKMGRFLPRLSSRCLWHLTGRP